MIGRFYFYLQRSNEIPPNKFKGSDPRRLRGLRNRILFRFLGFAAVCPGKEKGSYACREGRDN